MASIITHILRRTPMLYRSRLVLSNYRDSHRNNSNVSSRVVFTTFNQQNVEAESSNETSVNDSKLMEYLTSDAANINRVNYKVLHNVVTKSVKEYVSPSEGTFLLQCCTMLPDTNTEDKSKLVDSIWNDGILKCGDPTKEQIIALLRAYRVIGRTIDDFNSFLTQHNCEGDVELYEEYLHLMCESGIDPDGIAKILTDMKDREYPLTEKLFNAVILGHSKNKNLENCETVLDTMMSVYISPSSETYMHLVRAYIENGDTAKATQLLSDQGGTFSQEQIFQIVRTAAVNNSVALAKHAMKFLPVDSLLNKSVVPGLRNICTELINMDNAEMAYTIIDNLPQIKFTDGESTDSFGIFFIHEMSRRNDDWSKIMDIAQRLVDSNRNDRALHCCCGIMLRANSPNSLDCLKYLSGKEALQPHYFWPILHQQYRTDGESGMLNVLQEMRKLKVPVDEETINQFLPKLTITMKDAKQGVKMLCDKGVPINVLLTSTLRYLLQQLRIEEALDLMKTHKAKVDGDKLIGPLILTVRKLDESSPITGFVELVRTIEARSQKNDLVSQILVEAVARSGKTIDASVFAPLLKQFHTSGIKISTTVFNQMQLHVQNNLPVEFHSKSTALLNKMLDKTIEVEQEHSGIFKHPRDMTVNELECHLVELQSKNMNCRAVLRRLLQQLVREAKYDRAIEILQLCKDNNVEFSPGMLSSILDLMIHTKNLSEAEATLKQLKKMHPSFSVDEFKVIDLASLMIANGQMEKAKGILQERAKKKLIGGTHCHKNIWALLTNVATVSAANSSTVNQTDEFLQFLMNLGYCSFHNTLGGPIIKEYLLKNEIVNALAEFEKLVAKYKKTPMQFELMTTLITLSNKVDGSGPISQSEAKEMLSKLARTVMSVHGTRNANVSLIVAVAKAGTEGQLRKILMDPKLEFNAEMLLKQCEYLGTVNAVPALLKLAKCSRGVGRLASAFKEEDLYNLLLNEYIKDNNYEAALELFERMTEDEDIRLTKDFTRRVVDLLEKNNLELPTVLQIHLRRS